LVRVRRRPRARVGAGDFARVLALRDGRFSGAGPPRTVRRTGRRGIGVPSVSSPRRTVRRGGYWMPLRVGFRSSPFRGPRPASPARGGRPERVRALPSSPRFGLRSPARARGVRPEPARAVRSSPFRGLPSPSRSTRRLPVILRGRAAGRSDRSPLDDDPLEPPLDDRPDADCERVGRRPRSGRSSRRRSPAELALRPPRDGLPRAGLRLLPRARGAGRSSSLSSRLRRGGAATRWS
jgi:hypothetical protein